MLLFLLCTTPDAAYGVVIYLCCVIFSVLDPSFLLTCEADTVQKLLLEGLYRVWYSVAPDQICAICSIIC